MGGKVGSGPACDGASRIGSNPDICQNYKIGGTIRGAANTLLPLKKYAKNNAYAVNEMFYLTQKCLQAGVRLFSLFFQWSLV
jgi:hypothetical protein